ncbi:MAG: integrase domain-containing protein [Gammaproteobacteria bacterium]|nr:integrase domain-containing protein [Gammaproteobacteria bacterium]
MKDLNFELSILCRRNRDGSYSTRGQRYARMQRHANTLQELGFYHMHATSLKPKHVTALVEHWIANGNTAGTLQNYMSDIRWWAEKVGKSHIMHPSNEHYGIPPRDHTPRDKAQLLSEDRLLSIENDFVRTSVRLQQAFGLRREESIKFRPSYADQKTFIRLKGSWTKGGRPRDIPIAEPSQRELLDQVHEFVGSGSLIPNECLYKHQLRRYDYHVEKAGLNNLHGLRHGYAQRRYLRLTGWYPPSGGGPKFSELTKTQQEIDQEVRLKVSRELGHNRIEITRVYLG